MYYEVIPHTGNQYNRRREPPEQEPEVPFFIRGTTPPFEFNIFANGEPADLSELSALEAYVSQTIDDEKITVTKTAEDMDIDGGRIVFFLSQEETLQFSAGTDLFPKYAAVQIRGLNEDGTAWATIAEMTVQVLEIMKEGVISAG